jgi:hypothetical protein
MSDSAETTRDDLLDLTPDIYLADGFLLPDGQIRPDLLSGAAVAAATQLSDDEVSPQEMAFTYEAIRALLPMHEGAAGPRLCDAVGEALAAVGRMIRQPNNEGLVSWCQTCAAQVHQEAEIAAFLEHMQVVMRYLALLASLPSPDELSSLAGSPSPGPGV